MHPSRQSCSLIILLLLTLFAPVAVCSAQESSEKTTAEEVRQETQEFTDTLTDYTAQQRDEAIKKSKDVLDKLDKRIADLETTIDNNWDKMEKASREKARASLKVLRKQRTKAAEWYGAMKNSSAEAWDHMKKGFADAYTALLDSWQKSEKEFGSDE
ncbi:MAG: hypothetical protein RI601_09400 [Desulfurivibrionaceae bacterium]|nr:hypothetical protein [Desulfurivibrionaceae bacterium]